MSYVANRNGNAPSLALKASDLKPRYADPAILPFRNAASIIAFIWSGIDKGDETNARQN